MAEQRYAVINEDGTVFTCCMWDPVKAPKWEPPYKGQTVVLCPDASISSGALFDKQAKRFTKAVEPQDEKK